MDCFEYVIYVEINTLIVYILKNKLIIMIFVKNFLNIGNILNLSVQRDAYTWALDHRVHHKYSETDADPHDVRRGFFFAHVGWLFITPHPDVVAKRKMVDMSDLEADPIVMWQKRQETYDIHSFTMFAFS